MKRVFFKLEGMIDVPDDVTLEQVEEGLAFNVGLCSLSEGNSVDLGLQNLPKNVSYYSVEAQDDHCNKKRYVADGVKATELANKLLAAASECGDLPVINSTVLPVPGGKSFQMVVYQKGDKYLELE